MTRINAEMRVSDISARFGGDEFCIVLPQADLQDGERVAQRVLDSVRGTPIKLDGDKAENVTLSIGVAAIGVCVLTAWFTSARQAVPLTALLSAPLYLIWKLPLYLAFLARRERRWRRRFSGVTSMPAGRSKRCLYSSTSSRASSSRYSA